MTYGLRAGLARWLAKLLLAGVGVAGLAPGQDVQFGRSDDGRGRLFSLPRSQDDIHEWRRAQEDVRAGRFADAVERLHRLRQSTHNGVVPLDDLGDRFAGLQAAVLDTLRELPDEGRAAYEKLAQREAGKLARTALETGDLESLETLADSFPATTAGVRARVLLGNLALEAGDSVTAEQHYRRALDATGATSALRPAIQQLLYAAKALGGRAPLIPAEAEYATAGAAAKAALASTPTITVNGYGGGSDGTGVMREPIGSLTLQHHLDIRTRGFSERMFPMHAVGDITGVLINDGLSLHCVDPLSGQLTWTADGPMVDDPDGDLAEYERSINHDMVLAATCSTEIVVAALQVPNEGKNQSFQRIDVLWRLPRRRLGAFDRATGKRLWAHWDHADGPVTRAFEGHDAAGPPLISGDTVYLASHDQTGAIALYLSAYDLRTGATKWRHLVCSSQGEVNMFGNARREYAASPLAIEGGVIYGTANLGVCFAADAATGHLRWVTAYEVIQMPEARLTDQQDRQVVFRNNPVVVTHGVMACTPLDSAYALGFDCQTGKQLWRLYYHAPSTQQRNDVRWLLGALDNELIFSGAGVIAVKTAPTGNRPLQPSYRKVRSGESLGLAADGVFGVSVPRGALADGRIWYASPGGLRVFDTSGETRGQGVVAQELDLGNLLLVDGLLVSVRDGGVDFYFDRDRLIQDAEQQVRAQDDDPAACLRLASLLRGASAANGSNARTDRAAKVYRTGLNAARRRGLGSETPVVRRLAAESFQLDLERARRLRASQPTAAFDLLREARDQTLRPQDWLEAQLLLLEWLHDQRPQYLAELELMASRHGDVQQHFAGVGTLPVAVFALWESAQHASTPEGAVRRAQELIERFPDLQIAGRPVRDAARELQGQVLRTHGVKIYAAVEAQAEDALNKAGKDSERLRALAARFPHAKATQRALRLVLDLAVESGDLGTAVRSFQQALGQQSVDAGMLRRLQVAATEAGNHGLAQALGLRLCAEHGNQPSDWPADGGKAFRLVAQPAPLPVAAPSAKRDKPLQELARLAPRAPGEALQLAPVRYADGFAAVPPPRLLVAVGGTQLQVFDPERGAEVFAQPLFTVPHAAIGEELWVCGNTLVLVELEQVTGIDLRDGRSLWSHRSGNERSFVNLGCEAGLLHVFSEQNRRGDGGVLLGLEPGTGAIVFQRLFSNELESIPPASSGGSLWMFRAGDRTTQAQLVELDPLSGEDRRALPLSPTLLRSLALSDADRRQWRARTIHRSIIADERAVYLAVDGDGVEPPRIGALGRDGAELWVWSGSRSRELAMLALHRDRLVVLERGADGSRLQILDRNTRDIRQERVLGPQAQILNWSRTERSQPAPDVLMLSEVTNRSLTFTLWSLRDGLASFTHALPGPFDYIVPEPQLGEDFLALAAVRRDGPVAWFVLDLQRRRSLLPDGRSSLRLNVNSAQRLLHRVTACGPQIAIQTQDGIIVFTDQRSK